MFTERNVGRDAGAREELMELGLTSLPVILIGERRLSAELQMGVSEMMRTFLQRARARLEAR